MSSRSIVQIFDQYQKARLAFVQSVSDAATRPQNIDLMKKAGVLDLLMPLVDDACPQIKQNALAALGKLIHADEEIAQRVNRADTLSALLANLNTGNKYRKSAVLFVLRSICKHGEKMADEVVRNGGLQALVYCLDDFDPMVKESAAWGIGYIARHSQNLARECVDHGSLPLLVLCLREPELSLKQIATSALSDVAKHSESLAAGVIDAGAIPHLVKNLRNSDAKLKRQSLTALSSCAKHSSELAEFVVEAEIFPLAFEHLSHPCVEVRRNAACLVRDIVKHSLELTQLVANTGGIDALLELLSRHPGSATVPCVSALGFIAGHSAQLALTVIAGGTIQLLEGILNHPSSNDDSRSVSVWALGQIGRHGPEHARAVASANFFPKLIDLYRSDASSEDLKSKCQNSLKMCLQKCLSVSALEPLLWVAPPEILKYVLGQYSKVLPHDPKARRLFVTSGGLQKVQQIEAKPGSTLMEYIDVINSCFPEEIVKYYSPGYPQTLLDKVEQYSPQITTVLRESGRANENIQTQISADALTEL